MRVRSSFLKLLPAAILLACAVFPADAQYYQAGSDPSSTKWSSIRGEHFDVIYPRQMDSLARRYLYLFEKYSSVTNAGLNVESAKLPLVLHPYEVRSNASVAWAPKRVDIFTTPLSSPLFALSWEEQLALHEGRHVSQMAHYRKGIYKLAGILAGEQAVSLGAGLNPSKTLHEGDAVSNETDFTNTGRGRSGDFLMYYRAAFDAGDFRSPVQWRFGSYKEYTPNKYVTGYFLNSFMRYHADNFYVTGDILSHQVKWWWRIFSGSHKSYQYASGLTASKNFRGAAALMSGVWKNEAVERMPFNDFESLLAKREKYYTSFTDIIPQADGVLAAKSGMQYARQLVKIDSQGKQHYLKPLSSSTSRLVPDGDSAFIFSEKVPDRRWELKSYSIIRRYDIAGKKFSDITSGTRYFNPAPSSDGNNILAVEYKVEGGSNVVILDRSGNLLQKIDAPEGFQLTELAQAGDSIYSVAVTGSGMGIYVYDGSSWSCIVEDQSREIRNFQLGDDGLLYFVSDLDGVSNVYSLDAGSGKLTRVVSAHFGTTTPTIRDSLVYYSDFDRLGYNPAVTDLRNAPARSADFEYPFAFKLADYNSRQALETVSLLSEEEDDALKSRIDKLESKPYGKFGHGIHIHSWLPVYADIDRIMDFSFEQFYQLASPGLTLISQNNLGTAVTTLGYGYHKGNWGKLNTIFDKKGKYDDFHSLHLNFNYSGLYPVFELAADFNDRHRTVSTLYDSETIAVDTTTKASLDLKARVYVPINLSKGGWSSGLVPQLEYRFSNDRYSRMGESADHFDQSLLYGVRYYRMLSTATSAKTPRWGLGIVASGKSAVGAVDNCGSLAYFNIYGYTPGIARDHGIKLSLSWQKQFQSRDYSYVSNIASMPRGYESEVLLDYAKFSLDYALPVYLFESSYNFLGYLMRFNLIPFFDIARNGTRGAEERYPYSYGTLFTMQFHPLRFGMSLDIGVRYSRTARGDNSFDLVLSSSL